MYLIERFSCPLNFFENALHWRSPDEAVRIVIVSVNEIADGVDEIIETAKYAASDALVGQFAKPTLYQVQPGRTGGREMYVETRMTFDPRLDLGVFVRGIVVHDEVKIKSGRSLFVDNLEELDPFLMTVTFHACAD